MIGKIHGSGYRSGIPKLPGGRLAFRSHEAAYESLRWDLRAVLRNPHFDFTQGHYSDYELSWYLHRTENRFNPLLDMLCVPSRRRFENPSHLTAEVARHDPELIELYDEKVGPLLIAIWKEAYDRYSEGERGRLLPNGIFVDTFQGKLNFNLVFRHVVESPEYMGLTFDRSTRTVPEQLRRENQPEYFLSQGCKAPTELGEHGGWWAPLMRKYLLAGGIDRIHNYSVYRAFSDADNYGWAFRYKLPGGRLVPEGQHLHWIDFQQRNMWENLSRGSRVWREIDHIIREHWGVAVYDPETGIDPRLFPEQHEKLIADIRARIGKPESPLGSFIDLFNASCLAGLMGNKKTGHHPGKILFLRYPEAFAPTPKKPEHLRVHWFKKEGKFKSVEEKREALEHEIEVSGIPWKEVPKRCDRPWFRSVYLEIFLRWEEKFVPVLEIFKEIFPEKFKDGTWHEGAFPAVGTKLDKAASFRKVSGHNHEKKAKVPSCGKTYFDAVTFYFPKEYIGITIRRASAEHALIYRKSTTFTVKGKRVEWQPARAFIFGPLAAEAKRTGKKSCRVPDSAFVELDDPKLPDHKIVEKLSGDLLEAGIIPHSLTIRAQKDLVRMYQIDREKGLAKFIKINKPT